MIIKYKGNVILNACQIKSDLFSLAFGLMFASKNKIAKGLCLALPKETKFNSVTTFFCFSTLDIIFLDKNKIVVDKVSLKPFTLSYFPKGACKYIIEAPINTFRKIQLGEGIDF